MRAMAVILFTIFIVSISGVKAEQSISVVADNWGPYNAVPLSNREGYFIDILRAIFEPRNIKVIYKIRTWKRSVRDVENGFENALLGPFKSEAPGFVFPKQEVGRTSLVFFTRTSSDWTFRGTNSLRGIKLGIIKGYAYRPWLRKYVHNSPNSAIELSGEDAIARNLQMLIRGRIDAIPSNFQTFMYRAKKLGIEGKVRFAGKDNIGGEKNLYIAFSPKLKISKSLAAMFDEGMVKLRDTGKLDRILSAYGLKDWRLISQRSNPDTSN
jgi:polar amino acid transport system substrate-binding protein